MRHVPLPQGYFLVHGHCCDYKRTPTKTPIAALSNPSYGILLAGLEAVCLPWGASDQLLGACSDVATLRAREVVGTAGPAELRALVILLDGRQCLAPT